MNNKQKVCLVIPSLQAGGMERVMSELAWYFTSKSSAEVHLVLYGLHRDIFYSIPDNIFVHKPDFIFNNRFRFFSTIRTLFFLRKKIQKVKPDAILSFGEYWNSFVLLSLFGLKFPVYVSDRCQPDKSLGKIHNTLRRFLYSRSKGVIVQTKKAKEIYQQIVPGAKLYVIGNPIRSVGNNGEGSRENIILSVGRLIHTKHHNRLIRIFLKVRAPGWKLVIVGGNALKQNNEAILKDLAVELNAEDRVVFAGTVQNVDEFYKKSKIFAFTSSSEGFPMVIGEALSAGLPVVSYNCITGPSEMITDEENGFLVPVFDDEQFQKKLQLLIDNDNLRLQMAEKARASIKKFSIETIGKQYLDFILPTKPK